MLAWVHSIANRKHPMHLYSGWHLGQKTSAQKNLKEAAAEAQRQATDPNLLSSLSRKQAVASHNLLKADTTAAGEDFERKRAWDWTIDESEKWDRRMAKKEKHREDVAFQDYRQDARKIYKRQLREMAPDMEGYEKQKAAAVQKAAMSGGLEVVETDDGELVAVDKDGTFYSTADSTDFVENKPDKAAVDRLVSDIRKAEEVRLKKRRERGMDQEEGDVTYINDKNSMCPTAPYFDRSLEEVYWLLSRTIQSEVGTILQQGKMLHQTYLQTVDRWCCSSVHGGDPRQLRARHNDMSQGMGRSQATLWETRRWWYQWRLHDYETYNP